MKGTTKINEIETRNEMESEIEEFKGGKPKFLLLMLVPTRPNENHGGDKMNPKVEDYLDSTCVASTGGNTGGTVM